ncbi:type VI secretion system tube protein TssD [Hyunsoonleella rubra]|uniref:Type VI secretion system tube protein TssD n=1 Tax=Hyunsoonleella rubra TaxID=1737062 RepID=A0ABW5TCA9_9FLAO
MSFLAKLTIEDNEYNVLSFSFSVSQAVHHGAARPSGRPVISHLSITLESVGNSGFYEWSILDYEQKDGEIVFYKRDAMASSRTLKFTGAFCINYNETFESSNTSPMVTSLVLAVETLELDSTVYVNPAIESA